MINKYSLSSLSETLGQVDYFICFASYEKRCRSIAESLEPGRISHSAVGFNVNRHQFNGQNRDYLISRLGSNAQLIEFNVSLPTVGADNCLGYLERVFVGDAKSIVIDITTFTHEGLLILIKLLRLKKRPDDKIKLAYVGAEEYSIGLEVEDKWLSKGTREIRSVLGYPGLIYPSRKLHLIVLVGFETERSRSLIDAYEPHLLSLGVGTQSSSITQKNFQANDLFLKKIARTYKTHEVFEIAPNDHEATLNSLRLQSKKHAGYNVVIAPMNTKMSTLAAAALAIEDESLQLCYAQAELYNYENYSSAGTTCYLVDL